MKKKILLSVISMAFIMSACKLDSNVFYDDVYTTSGDKQYATAPAPKAAETYDNTAYEESYADAADAASYTSSESYTDEGGTTYVTNNYYFDSDDYYDYAYAARIRRFHSPVTYCWGYYDPFYTNLYWYDAYPGSWGVSIYLGYNWCWPSVYYRPAYSYYSYCSYGFSYSWGWGCGYYRPYYGPGYYGPGYYGPHGPAYAHGYRHGYWDGYHAGYYHNNYDHNRSFTYGHFSRDVSNGKSNDRDYDRGNRPNGSGMGGGNYTNGNYANYYGSGVNAGPTAELLLATVPPLPPTAEATAHSPSAKDTTTL